MYELDFAITESNIDRYADETTENVKEKFQGRISEGPTLATVTGRPAFSLELSFEKPGGEPLRSRMIFVFERTEYFLNFQFTPQRADEVKRGSERVVKTFRIE